MLIDLRTIYTYMNSLFKVRFHNANVRPTSPLCFRS